MEENMTEQTTTPYRTYLEELARSRGLSGAEELARLTVEADPDFTVQEILESPGGGFGQALDDAISLSEEEGTALVRAWMETFIPLRKGARKAL
jgi:hypothetical protein